MKTLPHDKLHLKSDQSRFKNPRTRSGLDDASIRELAINIGLNGLLNPLLVLEDGLIVAGQRRYRAITWLMAHFALRPGKLREYGAIPDGLAELIADLTHEDVSKIEAQVRFFEEHGVPVSVITAAPLALGTSADGIALTDNLQRSDLSSYEIAAHFAHLIDQGATQADIVRLVGKSKTYVSRKLSTYSGACDELRETWAAGLLTEEHVQELAKLPHDEQRKKLAAPIPRGIRGPANRPGISTVKEFLGELEKHAGDITSTRAQYARGVLDALRWVSGEETSPEFAGVTEVVHASTPS